MRQVFFHFYCQNQQTKPNQSHVKSSQVKLLRSFNGVVKGVGSRGCRKVFLDPVKDEHRGSHVFFGRVFAVDGGVFLTLLQELHETVAVATDIEFLIAAIMYQIGILNKKNTHTIMSFARLKPRRYPQTALQHETGRVNGNCSQK
jgi:hypothetical protein